MTALNDTVQQVVELEDEIRQVEYRLKELKAKRHAILTQVLPDMMAEHGVVKLETPDYVLNLTEWVSGSLPKEGEARDRAFAALERIGGGSLIKAEVGARLPKGEIEQARRIAQMIAQQGYDPYMETRVHPQSLHAFIRQLLREGEPVPADELGIQVGQIVKVRAK